MGTTERSSLVLSAGRLGAALAALLLGPLLLGGPGCEGRGCSACGGDARQGSPEAALLAHVPAEALGVLVVPRVDRLSGQLAALYGALQPRFPDLARLADDLRARLGFDLLAPATLEKIGLDEEGSLVVAAHPDWVLLGLSASRPGRFKDYLAARFERELPGMLELRTVKIGARDGVLVVPRQPAGAPPVLAYVEQEGALLVVPGRGPLDQQIDPVQVLAGLLTTEPARSVAALPQFTSLQAATAGDGQAGLQLWLNTVPLCRLASTRATQAGRVDEARLLDGIAQAVLGASAGLRLNGERLQLTGRVLVEPAQYAMMKSHLAATRPAPDFGRLVGDDAVLLARGGFAPTQTYALARSYLPTRQREQLDQQITTLRSAGLDLEAELLASFSGNVAFSFYSLDLAAGLPALLAGRPDAFQPGMLDTATYLQLGDATRARNLLARIGEGLRAAGLALQTRREGPVELTELRAGGEFLGAWLLTDELLVLTTGDQRPARLLPLLAAAAAAAPLVAPPGSAGAVPPTAAVPPARTPGGLAGTLKDPGALRAVGPASQFGLFLSVKNLMRNLPFLALVVPQAGATLGTLGEAWLEVEILPDGVGGELTLTVQPAGGVQ